LKEELIEEMIEREEVTTEKPIDKMTKEEIIIYLMKSFEHTQYNQDAINSFNRMLLRLSN